MNIYPNISGQTSIQYLLSIFVRGKKEHMSKDNICEEKNADYPITTSYNKFTKKNYINIFFSSRISKFSSKKS